MYACIIRETIYKQGCQGSLRVDLMQIRGSGGCNGGCTLNYYMLGVVLHTCNPSMLGRGSLDYIQKLSSKDKTKQVTAITILMRAWQWRTLVLL